MRSRYWLVLGMLALPAPALAQTVKQTDLVGAWRAELEYPGRKEKEMVGLVLWSDGLWYYTAGSFMTQNHGGARWKLAGDTLWLANDYEPYFHPIAQSRIRKMLEAHGHLGIMDKDVVNGKPFPVPDSVYWSKTFRDTTSPCAGPDNHPCATWVYQVRKKDQQLSLVALESLSRVADFQVIKGTLSATVEAKTDVLSDMTRLDQYMAGLAWETQHMATTGVLTRDSLLGCASLNLNAGAGGECVHR